MFFRKKNKNPLYKFIVNTFGFNPKNISLYEIALIHRSASLYSNKNFSINNERLEFLGDAILNAVIGEYLFHKYVNENEGFLSNLRSRVVNRHTLNTIAIQLHIPEYVKQNIDNNGYTNIYGNTLEALIGAMFIDRGYEHTKKIVLSKIIQPYIDWEDLINNDTNYKGKIIDWVQKHHLEIEFKTHPIRDKENNYLFESEVLINSITYGRGKGNSKKEAEQCAAKEALLHIKL